MTLGRFDENQRAVIKKNPLLRRQTLGPPVSLDVTQKEILGMFHHRRSQTHPDRGISVDDVEDRVIQRLLLSMDRIYLNGHTENRRMEIEKAKAAAGKRPRVPRTKEIGER